jgi:hypothetical protein
MRQPVDILLKPCEVFASRHGSTKRADSFDKPIMKSLRALLLILSVAIAVATARATTVIPPTFDQLVADAEMIFEGTVSSTRSEWTGQGTDRHIVTYVTFKVEDALKGTPGAETTLRMFGGTVDGQTIEVADAPRFKIGDRDILFVEHNGTQFIPLVGIMHGRFHVQRDGIGVNEIIAKDNGAPLAHLAQLGQDENAAVAGKALSKADFKAAIRQKLAQTAVK